MDNIINPNKLSFHYFIFSSNQIKKIYIHFPLSILNIDGGKLFFFFYFSRFLSSQIFPSSSLNRVLEPVILQDKRKEQKNNSVTCQQEISLSLSLSLSLSHNPFCIPRTQSSDISAKGPNSLDQKYRSSITCYDNYSSTTFFFFFNFL